MLEDQIRSFRHILGEDLIQLLIKNLITAPDEAAPFIGPIAEMEEPKKITDLPDICLDKILSVLSIYDLFNVVEMEGVLAKSAKRVFKLYHRPKHELNYRRTINGKFETIFCATLKHFGETITDFQLFMIENRTCWSTDDAIKLLAEKCPSLERLSIRLCTKLELKRIFPNVRELKYIVDSPTMHGSWIELNRFFPSLQSFQLSTIFSFPFQSNVISNGVCPQLKSFTYGERYDGNWQQIGQFINSNSQLEMLKLQKVHSIERLQSAIHWQTMSINDLTIYSKSGCTMNLANFQMIRNLRSLSIGGLSQCENINNTNLSKLEKLNILFKRTKRCIVPDLDPSIIDFLEKYPHLKTENQIIFV